MRLKTHMVDYYRREGHGADGWVLKGDVRHFFASIDHRKLNASSKPCWTSAALTRVSMSCFASTST